MHVRPVRPADLDLIRRHREEMFRDSGRAEAVVAAMSDPFRLWLQPRLEDGRYFGFVAEAEGAPIGGVGLMEIDWPPHPLHPHEDRRGYVLNVFVEPSHRGRGVARALMAAADAEFARRGVSYLVLHATEAGRVLYEQIGWTSTAEMAKTLERS
jgi:GNAT superfamily N-acetyltransferase